MALSNPCRLCGWPTLLLTLLCWDCTKRQKAPR